jgi:hypothetical protein
VGCPGNRTIIPAPEERNGEPERWRVGNERPKISREFLLRPRSKAAKSDRMGTLGHGNPFVASGKLPSKTRQQDTWRPVNQVLPRVNAIVGNARNILRFRVDLVPPRPGSVPVPPFNKTGDNSSTFVDSASNRSGHMRDGGLPENNRCPNLSITRPEKRQGKSVRPPVGAPRNQNLEHSLTIHPYSRYAENKP